MADELSTSSTLRERLDVLQEVGERMPLEEAVEVVRQVALAADRARRQGAPCRGVRPEDIVLEPAASEALPYGPVPASRSQGAPQQGGLDATSAAALAYMSPEETIGDPGNARSDVYSLGILLYELVVGQLPFPVKTLTEAIRAHTKEPPPPPRSLRPDLPEPVAAVILKALQKAPADRFAHPAALAEALAAALPARQTEEPPATEADDVPVEPLGEPTGDVIAIVGPDGNVRSYPCRRGVMRIGRSPDNDVVLDYAGVEPHHARLHVDADGCRLESVTTSGETHLGTKQLVPGMVETWTPNRLLRIGDVRVHLEPAPRQVAPPPPPKPEPQPKPPSLRRPLLCLGLAAGGLLICVIAAFAILPRLLPGPVPVPAVPTSRPVATQAVARPTATVEPTGLPTAEPTAAPPTEEPTTEPVIVSSPTPCPGAGPRFADAYVGSLAEIGCPAGAPVDTFMAVQRFERGLMFWSEDSKEIHVLSGADGARTWHRYPDTWVEGLPDRDPSLVPPGGLEQPIRGFGKVWREELGGPDAAIGWATESEQGFDGGRQAFANGLLLAGPDGEVYALFADGHWERQ